MKKNELEKKRIYDYQASDYNLSWEKISFCSMTSVGFEVYKILGYLKFVCLLIVGRAV